MVKVVPCGFWKKNLPLLFFIGALRAVCFGERIFFPKTLPKCPAHTGAVLNKKPAKPCERDLKNEAAKTKSTGP
jgi:hypothetical protein